MNISQTLYALVCFLRRGHQSGNTTLALSGMLNASPAPGRDWEAPRLVYLTEALARSTERHTGIPCLSLASPSSVLLAKPGPVLFDAFTVEELAEMALQRIDDLEGQLAVSRRAQDPLAELRDALVESMGTEGGIPMTDRLAAALNACGIYAKREASPSSTSPVVEDGRPTLDAIEAQWNEFLEYLDPQAAGEECAYLGHFAALLDIARDQRDQLSCLREIEVSEDCHGLLSAHGADGTILVCGEFKSGREFKEKYRLRSSPAPAVGGVPDEVCTRVEQTRLHNPPESIGNCFSAVLAGLLKLPIEQIPDFDNPHWRRKLNAWLAQFGLAWIQVEDLAHFRVVYGIEGLWHETGGASPRDPGVLHAVCGKDGVVEWDPHPSQAGITNMSEGHGIFVALRPWELASRAFFLKPKPGKMVDHRELMLLRQHFELMERELNADDPREVDAAFNARQEVEVQLREHLRPRSTPHEKESL